MKIIGEVNNNVQIKTFSDPDYQRLPDIANLLVAHLLGPISEQSYHSNSGLQSRALPSHETIVLHLSY